MCLAHVPEITEWLKSRITVQKDKDSSSIEEQALPEALAKFLQEPTEERVKDSIEPLFELVRDLWRIEENKVYEALSKGESVSGRIQATAEITKDLYYLGRQGIALVRFGALVQEKANQFLEEAGERTYGLRKDSEAVKQELSKVWKEALREVAPKLADACTSLGPYWEKLAQTAGAIIYGFDSDAYRQVEHLQNEAAHHMSGPKTIRVIEQNLGAPIEELYARFDPKPFAVASIAQVHHAEIRTSSGETKKVVVKVKKETVEEELAWNLRVNQAFAQWVKATNGLGNEHFLLDFLADQALSLGESFQSELDFVAEARRQERFRRLYKFHSSVTVPRVYRDLSGSSVITMEDIGDAEKLNFDFTPDKISDEERGERRKDKVSGDLEKISGRVGKAKPRVEVVEEDEAEEQEEDKEVGGRASKESSRPSDGEVFHKLYNDLGNKFGFRLGPQYAQLIRALAPPLGLLFSLDRQAGPLLRSDKALTNNEKVQLKKIRQRVRGVSNMLIHQALHIQELHSDLQPANLLIDSENRLNLIDYGQTVKTRGLLSRPIRLLKNIATGDAPRAAKALAGMGSMKPEYDQQDLVPVIQEAFDAMGLEKRSLWKVFTSLRDRDDEKEGKAEKKVASDQEETGSEQIEKESPDSESNRSSDELDRERKPPESEEEKKTSKERERPSSPYGKVLRSVAKSLMAYPFIRSYYGALSLYDRAARWLGY